MPLKGAGGIWRPLKSPGRAGGGGKKKEKTRKWTSLFVVFLFFFFPPPLALPSLLKASLFPHLLTLFIYSRKQRKKQHLRATKYFWRYLEAMLVYPDIPYFLFSMRYQEKSHRTQESNISIL